MLKIILAPIGYIYGTVSSLFKGGIKEWNEWNKQLAIAKDQYGNGLMKYILNDSAINEGGCQFGNIDETISSVLGKNKRKNKLKPFGRFLSSLLNGIDKHHVEDAIDEEIPCEIK